MRAKAVRQPGAARPAEAPPLIARGGRPGRPEGGGAGRPRKGARLSRAVEDYLKAVWKLQAGGETVATSALADELGRSAASVTNMVKALAEESLLEHVPYHGVRLTAAGEAAALRIVRRHRVIESYLIERLGYGWDGVHAEAERLEHAASDDLVERMARALGDPATDPHGAPIPSADLRITESAWRALPELSEGTRARVREVSDSDAGRLRELAVLGLFLDTELTVLGAGPDGTLTVRVGTRELVLEPGLAAAVRVETLEGPVAADERER